MKITIHRNLNAGDKKWSWCKPKATRARCIVAHNVTAKQPSGKKFQTCLAGGKRGVFAWFKTSEPIELLDEKPSVSSNAVRVRFNPKAGDLFFHVDGNRVDNFQTVYFLPSGECWAILESEF